MARLSDMHRTLVILLLVLSCIWTSDGGVKNRQFHTESTTITTTESSASAKGILANLGYAIGASVKWVLDLLSDVIKEFLKATKKVYHLLTMIWYYFLVIEEYIFDASFKAIILTYRFL